MLEIKWRTEDGTLAFDKIPDSLNMERLGIQKQELTTKQDELGRKTEMSQEELKTIVSRLEKTKKTLIETEAGYTSMEKRYALELKQITLEKEYSEQSPERLTAALSKLQEERLWLNGTFNMSRTRFSNSEVNASGIQKQIEALSPPELPEMLQKDVIRAEEIEQASKQVDEIVAYYSGRMEKLGEFRSALESLIKSAEAFQGDAAVLTEQLSKMQVIAQILEAFIKEGKLAADSIPSDATSGKLTDESKKVSELVAEAMSGVQKSKEQLTWIEAEIKKSEAARKETREKLASLKKSQEAEAKAQQWEADIKDLTAQGIVQKFKENAEKLRNNQAVIKERRTEYKKTNAAVEEARQKYESLKDPLLRAAQDESAEEKNNILKTLYEFAGLEPPAEKKKSASKADSPKAGSPEAVKKEAGEKPSDKDSAEPEKERKEAEAKPPAKDASDSDTEEFQNLLSNRTRIVDEKQKHRSRFINELKSLDQKIERYAAALTETVKLAMQQFSSAMEIKKRVGRGELKTDEIPEGITEALKRESIIEVEENVSGKLNYQMHIRQEIERLGKDDEIQKKVQKLLTDMQILIGKRLDITSEIKKLNLDFKRKRDKLSTTELKSLEQAATRRLKSEYTLKELLVGFVPTEEEKNLTELLQAYYTELTELEKKHENLNERKDKIERLIKLAENEKTSDSELMPLLQNQAEHLASVKEEESVKIRAQLMPKKAEEILGNFEAKTGRRLPTPVPVLEKHRIPAIKKAAALIFDLHIQIVAVGKWISLFEQRGIDAEIGRYQDKMGTLNSAYSAIERRIQYLTGHSPADLAKLTPDEKPRTEIGRHRFLKGEIGILREDRYKILKQAATLVGAKLASIFLAAILITLFVNGFINRFINRSRKSGKGTQKIAVRSQDRDNRSYRRSLSLTGVLPLLKSILIFIVWVTALISSLSTLGFNVGAILAGLGIGGLAIAMASKETLSDILGGISILSSGSLKVGDFIMFKGDGTCVEEIGLRYTRLRVNATQFMITVPNSLLAQTESVNMSAAPSLFMNIDIPLSTTNSEGQIRLAMQRISEIFDKNSDAKLTKMRFSSFDNYSFCIAVNYTIQDFSLRCTIQTTINTEIVRQFQENNIKFADMPYFNAE
ncbi:mechanosensitive ion channel [Desulfococcaceae bacterium HSG9]|nr:mechanosensitive ion channel [Desulfococcaceae bacterium HSG9]